MNSYDGPSYFKNNHPKIERIKQDIQHKKEKTAKYKLPKNIRTRDDFKDDARQYMKTPSNNVSNDPPPERFPFKNKHIPSSLQKLKGWNKQNTDITHLSEIAARLQKEGHTYLLFEEHLSDEIREELATRERQSRDTHFEQKNEKQESPKKKETTQKKVEKIKKETTRRLMKPNTGLHRSLSSIIAEEQKGLQKRNSKLNSLFTEEKKNKKS